MELIKGQEHQIPIIKEITEDLQGIIKILEDNYLRLQARSMKIRFTKLKKKLIAAVSPDRISTDEDIDATSASE